MINTIFQIGYLILIFISFCAVTKSIAQSEKIENNEQNPKMNITFRYINDQRIKDSFLEVFTHFDIAHDYDIPLVQNKLKATTMQAQPILHFKSFFTGVKKYRIKMAMYVKDSDDILVSELPDDVLRGWFAHELGHLVDYEARSSFGMIIYGFKYILSKKFKRSIEHRADSIAVANGFALGILAMKKFILENESLSEGITNLR